MNKLHLTRFLLDNHRVPTWDFKIRLKLKDKKYPISMEVKQRFKKTLNTNIYPKILYFYTYLHKYSSIQPIKFTHTRHPVFFIYNDLPAPLFYLFFKLLAAYICSHAANNNCDLRKSSLQFCQHSNNMCL